MENLNAKFEYDGSKCHDILEFHCLSGMLYFLGEEGVESKLIKDNGQTADSYEISLTKTHPSVLRAYCNFKTKDGDYMAYENFDNTLHSWLKNNIHLISCGNHRIGVTFQNILRDIVRGIVFFNQKLHRSHGNIKTECVVIVNGRGKLINAETNEKAGVFKDDLEQLRSLLVTVCSLFKKEDRIPEELCDFISFLTNYQKKWGLEFAKFIEYHPLLLTSVERYQYRMLSYAAVNTKHAAIIKKDMDLLLKKRGLSGFSWKNAASHSSLLNCAYINQFPDSIWGFYTFCRCYSFHAREAVQITREEIDERLTEVHPKFIGILFEALINKSVFSMGDYFCNRLCG